MGKRIGFIDAMRGLAMLLVVIGHVLNFSVCHLDNAIMRILSDEVEIPLFFMVSGFLVNIPKSGFWKFLGKKAFLLFVPAAVFMALYVWMEGSNYISAWIDSYKGGYWFTFSLFQFVAVYAVLKLVSQAMKLSRISERVFLVAVSVVILYASVWCLREEHNYAVIPLLGLVHFKSFIYFVVGTQIAECGLLGRGLSSKEVTNGGGIIVACILLHFYTYRGGGIAYIGSSTLWLAMTTLSALIVILMGFKQYEGWSESPVGRLLQMLGRYTLDIYFIHYFFLPRNMAGIGEWFKANPNPIIEYMLAMAVAVVVIAASLLVGRIIRLSPILAHWLLAAKR